MARGTHVRTFRRQCGSYPLAGDPAARSRSALQALENPRHCSHSCSPLREAVRALHFSQLPPGPLRELQFYIVCSYQENLFSWFRVQLDLTQAVTQQLCVTEHTLSAGKN